MAVLDEVLSANEQYASSFGAKGELALPPARRFAILTCMDARLDPAKYAGLSEGDAHVIRNAGGRASDDAIRSLVISYKLLGTQEWFVVHHTNCGMEFFDSAQMGELCAQSLDTAELGPDGFGMSAPDPAPTKAATSTGSRSPTPSRASSTTSPGSARTRSSRPGSRSTATSTTSRPAASTRLPRRPRPAEQHDLIPRGGGAPRAPPPARQH